MVQRAEQREESIRIEKEEEQKVTVLNLSLYTAGM